jgi:PAS domain S-box-containing protein
LHLLVVEDSTDDAELVVGELRRKGFDVTYVQVDTKPALERELDRAADYDLVISDYSLPSVDAPAVLERVRSRTIDLPCIVLSGTVSEAIAVETMRLGARDYVAKSNLTRLAAAVSRELMERDARAEQRRSEAALQQSFRTVIERVPDGIIVHRGGTVVYANPAAKALFGARVESELVGRALTDLLPAESPRPSRSEAPVLEHPRQRGEDHLLEHPRQRGEDHLLEHPRQRGEDHLPEGRARSPSIPPVEQSLRRIDGSTLFAEITTTPVVFGGAPAILAVIRDVTTRREITAKMMEVDRMLAIGTLAAGVGHEINNPLAYVLANVDYVLASLGKLGADLDGGGPQDPEARATAFKDELAEVKTVLEEVVEGAQRIRDIVRDLRAFSRAEDLVGPVDVHPILDSVLNLASNELKHRARVVREYGDVPPVEANASRIGQAFLNLVVNAAHAIAEGARHKNELRIKTYAHEKKVTIEISDTGIGISPENMGRIFTPFFTTKPLGHGTGLGLAICRSIVRAVDGEILAESEPGKGSVFRVCLHASSGAVPHVSVLPPGETTRRGRVLFIDDEHLVGTAFSRLLSREHDIVVVTRADDAVANFERGERFDAIFCDLMMPDMSGMDLYEVVQARFPELLARMVFITGGAYTQRSRAFLAKVENVRIEKPLEIGLVRSVLAQLVH